MDELCLKGRAEFPTAGKEFHFKAYQSILRLFCNKLRTTLGTGLARTGTNQVHHCKEFKKQSKLSFDVRKSHLLRDRARRLGWAECRPHTEKNEKKNSSQTEAVA